jgi:hypothetical protein
MFLKGLNDIQQKLFLGIAQQLVEADGKVTRQERDTLYALSSEMGQEEMIPAPDDDVLLAFFPDPDSRGRVLLELIGLSACDGVDPAEHRIIQRLQRLFEISGPDLKAYQTWVKKFLALKTEATRFFSGPSRQKAAAKAKGSTRTVRKTSKAT